MLGVGIAEPQWTRNGDRVVPRFSVRSPRFVRRDSPTRAWRLTSYDSSRRAYPVLDRLALVQDPGGLALAVSAIHDALPGTPLPADMPNSDRLAAAGYTAVEDLEEADVEELVVHAGLTERESRAVLLARP